MRTFLSRLAHPRRGLEHGQALVLFAAGLAGFIGMVGLAVDGGQVVFARTDLQKLADSAVFAAAQDLPNTTEARESADEYAHSDQFATTALVEFSATYGANDTVQVTVNRRVNYWFLRAVGLSGTNVSARAKARASAYSGGRGLLPWGFIASNDDNSKLLQNSCYLGQSGGVPQFKQNQPCTLKYGAGTNGGGDFGALALDGTGADIYRESIQHGSNKYFKAGDLVDAETGNMQGPTTQGMDDRFALPPPAGCPGNDKSDVLIQNVSDGSVSIRPGCEYSPRIGLIPVVNRIDNPQKSTILGFAFVFLTGTTGSGGGTQVKAEFVKYVTELPNSYYTGTGSNGATAVKLVE